MSIERTVGLTVPEIPTGDVDQGRVHDFIRQIFILNGFLDEITSDPDNYFKFDGLDVLEKRDDSVSYYWASEDCLPLIFSANFTRRSKDWVESRQRIASRQSDGFITEAQVGAEQYSVRELSLSPRVNSGGVLFGSSLRHITGASHFYDASISADVFGTYWNDIDRTMHVRPSDAHVRFLEKIAQRLSAPTEGV